MIERLVHVCVCVCDAVWSDNQIALGQRVPARADSGAASFNQLKNKQQACSSAFQPLCSPPLMHIKE